jgi:periplasmic protein TonB
MDRHFALPATIAAALHAGLFFGFSSRPAPITTPVIHFEDEVKCALQITQDPPRVSAEEQSTPTAGGSTALPDLVQIPKPTDDSRFPVTLQVDPSSVRPSGPVMRIDGIGPPGPGTIAGPYVAPGIPSAVALDSPPHARLQMAPQYPAPARSEGRSGDVTVEFIVDEQGRVLEPRVVNSTDSIFDTAAVQAVAKWRFEPGTVHGRVVRFRMAVPLVFRLNDE